MNGTSGSRNTRLLLRRTSLLKHKRKQINVPRSRRRLSLRNASLRTIRNGFMLGMLLSIPLLLGCASPMVVVPSSRPTLPPPPAEIMKPAQPNYLQRMESFLSGKLPEPTQ